MHWTTDLNELHKSYLQIREVWDRMSRTMQKLMEKELTPPPKVHAMDEGAIRFDLLGQRIRFKPYWAPVSKSLVVEVSTYDGDRGGWVDRACIPVRLHENATMGTLEHQVDTILETMYKTLFQPLGSDERLQLVASTEGV